MAAFSKASAFGENLESCEFWTPVSPWGPRRDTLYHEPVLRPTDLSSPRQFSLPALRDEARASMAVSPFGPHEQHGQCV